jgi:hypothetical protein
MFPTTYNKREMNIVSRMLSLMKKFGLTFEEDSNKSVIHEFMEALDNDISERFTLPEMDIKTYQQMGRYLQRKFKWYMDREACSEMMVVAHHLAVFQVKK